MHGVNKLYTLAAYKIPAYPAILPDSNRRPAPRERAGSRLRRPLKGRKWGRA